MINKKSKDEVILYSDNQIFKKTDRFGNVITHLCMLTTILLIILGIVSLFNI